MTPTSRKIADLTRTAQALIRMAGNALNPRELHEYGFAYKGIGRGTCGSVRAQVLGAPLSRCAGRMNTQRRMQNWNLELFRLAWRLRIWRESLDFYEKFGFKVIDGGHLNEAFADSETEKWRILQNESATIGLFQGMFDVNILTFNPKDLRPIQASLKEQSVEFDYEADMTTSGPCSASLKDPDGNIILLDQHY